MEAAAWRRQAGMPVNPRFMQGETADMMRLAARTGSYVEFDLALNKKPIFGVVIAFNDYTGRIRVLGGGQGQKWVRSFLIRQVKCFTWSEELESEWKRLQDTTKTSFESMR